jgi:hypothetical protein
VQIDHAHEVAGVCVEEIVDGAKTGIVDQQFDIAHVLQPISQLFDFVAVTEVSDVRFRPHLKLRGEGFAKSLQRFLATVHKQQVMAPLSQLTGERGA